MIKVLLVDDQKVIREQLKSYFEPEANLQVVDTAKDSIEALSKIKTLRPNLVLMDVEMPGGISGLELTSMISNLFPGVKVIILTGNYTEEYGQQAVRVGAGAYLPKSIDPEGLIAAVKQVCQVNHLATATDSSEVNQGNASEIISYRDAQPLSNSDSKPELLATQTTPLYADEPKDKQPNLFKFCRRGIILNSIVWISALAYLKFTPATYTSQWGVKILETDSGVEVVLPDGGKATPAAGGWTPPTGQDPRNDYVYVATSPDLLAEAAAQVDMTVEEYQEPTIKVDEENGIIAFQIDGSSAAEARAKAQAFHQTMIEQIESLRQTELARQQEETQATLAEAKAKLVAAQNKLSEYRAESGISTDEQIKNLTDNIENLRRQKAELAAQQEGVGKRYAQLQRDIDSLAAPLTGDAYQLSGDAVYQEYRSRYAQAQSSLTNLTERFTPSHPIIKNKQAELTNTATALRQRAAQILGRPISLTVLARMDSLTLDPQNVLARESLQQDLVNNRAEWQRLKAHNQELTAQIDTLEARLRSMSQGQFEVDSLTRDLQVAETVFAATLAKLDLGQENIYSIYPPLQLVTKPNLPEKPSNPRPSSILMGGLAGSFLITTGLGLLWFDQKKFGFNPAISEPTLSPTTSVSTI
ncbi:MAG: response regulator [Cyanobacteria bacterium J06642_3]